MNPHQLVKDCVNFDRIEQTCCLWVVGGRTSSSKVVGVHNIAYITYPIELKGIFFTMYFGIPSRFFRVVKRRGFRWPKKRGFKPC